MVAVMSNRTRNLIFLVAELGEDRDDTTKARTVSATTAQEACDRPAYKEPIRVVGIRVNSEKPVAKK